MAFEIITTLAFTFNYLMIPVGIIGLIVGAASNARRVKRGLPKKDRGGWIAAEVLLIVLALPLYTVLNLIMSMA
jgi:hypothetical protein